MLNFYAYFASAFLLIQPILSEASVSEKTLFNDFKETDETEIVESVGQNILG